VRKEGWLRQRARRKKTIEAFSFLRVIALLSLAREYVCNWAAPGVILGVVLGLRSLDKSIGTFTADVMLLVHSLGDIDYLRHQR
jgi:hypothetical protein